MHHIDAVAKLPHPVVAVVAQPAAKLVGVVVVVKYDVPTAGHVSIADRAVECCRFRILPMQFRPDPPLVSPAIVASVLPQHAACQRVVDREAVEWFRFVAPFADPH